MYISYSGLSEGLLSKKFLVSTKKVEEENESTYLLHLF